jgi:ABC-2 type transport system permease protein
MPVVQIILFGFAVSAEVKNTKVAVFDPSNDISTRRIIEQINAVEYFSVEYFLTPNEIHEAFKKEKIGLGIVFSENFNGNLFHTGEASIQLLADATDPNYATSIINYASSIIALHKQSLMIENSVSPDKNAKIIVPQMRILYNPSMKSAYNFVPGVMGLILMLICAMMTSIAIVREKEMGTMEVLLVSPIKPLYIIIAKMTPYFMISCINMVTILLLSVFVLNVPVAGSLMLLNCLSLLFILVALSLGLLISTLVNTQAAAILISGMGLMMPIMLLSGMMFPVENMPDILQWFSGIIPARWYIAAVKKVMIQGAPIEYVIKEIVILASMAVLIIALSLKKSKIRL